MLAGVNFHLKGLGGLWFVIKLHMWPGAQQTSLICHQWWHHSLSKRWEAPIKILRRPTIKFMSSHCIHLTNWGKMSQLATWQFNLTYIQLQSQFMSAGCKMSTQYTSYTNLTTIYNLVSKRPAFPNIHTVLFLGFSEWKSLIMGDEYQSSTKF